MTYNLHKYTNLLSYLAIYHYNQYIDDLYVILIYICLVGCSVRSIYKGEWV